MAFYEEMAALAVEMLQEFGAVSTLTQYSATYDKTQGRRSAKVETSYNVLAVVGPREITDENGRVVVRTIATLSAKPQQGDKLTMGSRSWIVGKVTEINPAGLPIVWEAEVE